MTSEERLDLAEQVRTCEQLINAQLSSGIHGSRHSIDGGNDSPDDVVLVCGSDVRVVGRPHGQVAPNLDLLIRDSVDAFADDTEQMAVAGVGIRRGESVLASTFEPVGLSCRNVNTRGRKTTDGDDLDGLQSCIVHHESRHVVISSFDLREVVVVEGEPGFYPGLIYDQISGDAPMRGQGR